MKKAIAYVDGSYKNGVYGWGYVLQIGRKVFTCNGGDHDICQMRNVTGEIEAVKRVVRECIRQKVDKVVLYYDYAGIENWVNGKWESKRPETQAYSDFIRNCGLKIIFEKVPAHKGIPGNETADKLAKNGLNSVKMRARIK